MWIPRATRVSDLYCNHIYYYCKRRNVYASRTRARAVLVLTMVVFYIYCNVRFGTRTKRTQKKPPLFGMKRLLQSRRRRFALRSSLSLSLFLPSQSPKRFYFERLELPTG